MRACAPCTETNLLCIPPLRAVNPRPTPEGKTKPENGVEKRWLVKERVSMFPPAVAYLRSARPSHVVVRMYTFVVADGRDSVCR